MTTNKESLKADQQLLSTDLIETQAPGGYVVKATISQVLDFILASGGVFTGPVSVPFLRLVTQELTASGAMSGSMLQLNHATVKIEATLTQILSGTLYVITQTDAGTAAHTVTLAAGTFDGTNNTATFDAASETLVVLGIADGIGVIVLNSGTVALTSV